MKFRLTAEMVAKGISRSRINTVSNVKITLEIDAADPNLAEVIGDSFLLDLCAPVTAAYRITEVYEV